MISIKHRFSGATLCEFDVETVKEAVLLAIKKCSDLSGSDLRGSDLSGSNLSYSNLSGSNLSYSNLSGSDLSGSDLSGSNLSYSNLIGSDLSGSYLSGIKIDGEEITKPPLSITGLYYRCLITDGYMRLGCKRYTHAEWSEFNDSEIAAMDSHATEFWNQWKLPLLAMCKQHAESK